MLYIARKLLGYTEDEFWTMTPRKYASQLASHKFVENQKFGGSNSRQGAAPQGFIDQITGW